MHHATCLVEFDNLKTLDRFLNTGVGGTQVIDLRVSMTTTNGITYSMKEFSEIKTSGGFLYVASF